ncbi:hypothetical protein GTE46_005092 [Salmonella enterica subsp. enterica]|nr:hypothetical protein [Salmonella enterica subsp. enterica]EDY2803572.1 hypothetical protein [Salmonella enterica subsp. enterica]
MLCKKDGTTAEHYPLLQLLKVRVPPRLHTAMRCGGVATQAYGQPDNPVTSTLVQGNQAILTAAPFRGLPQL